MKCIIPLLFFVAALASGCSKSEDSKELAAPAPATAEQQTPTTATPATPATAATPATEQTAEVAEPAEADLPVEADFEDEANDQITDENLEKELAAIEKEIGE